MRSKFVANDYYFLAAGLSAFFGVAAALVADFFAVAMLNFRFFVELVQIVGQCRIVAIKRALTVPAFIARYQRNRASAKRASVTGGLPAARFQR